MKSPLLYSLTHPEPESLVSVKDYCEIIRMDLECLFNTRIFKSNRFLMIEDVDAAWLANPRGLSAGPIRDVRMNPAVKPRGFDTINFSYVHQYGLQHTMGLDLGSAAFKAVFCKHVEDQIKHFEPRLEKVSVSFCEEETIRGRQLRLKVSAHILFNKKSFKSFLIWTPHHVLVEAIDD